MPTGTTWQHEYYVEEDEAAEALRVLRDTPEIVTVLLEVYTPLQAAFGVGCRVMVRVHSGDDGAMVRAVVQLPAIWEGDPDTALAAVDMAWGLANCDRTHGMLVFDYERQG